MIGQDRAEEEAERERSLQMVLQQAEEERARRVADEAKGKCRRVIPELERVRVPALRRKFRDGTRKPSPVSRAMRRVGYMCGCSQVGPSWGGIIYTTGCGMEERHEC